MEEVREVGGKGEAGVTLRLGGSFFVPALTLAELPSTWLELTPGTGAPFMRVKCGVL